MHVEVVGLENFKQQTGADFLDIAVYDENDDNEEHILAGLFSRTHTMVYSNRCDPGHWRSGTGSIYEYDFRLFYWEPKKDQEQPHILVLVNNEGSFCDWHDRANEKCKDYISDLNLLAARTKNELKKLAYEEIGRKVADGTIVYCDCEGELQKMLDAIFHNKDKSFAIAKESLARW